MEIQDQGGSGAVVNPDGSDWSVVDVSWCHHEWSEPFELAGRRVRKCTGGCRALVLGAALVENPPEFGMNWDGVVLVDKSRAFRES